MAVRGLVWVTGITLLACSAGEVTAPAALPRAQGPVSRAAESVVAPVSAPLSDSTAQNLARDDRGAALPMDGESLAGPVLPPEVVSVMTHEQYRLTLDAHGPGITAFESNSGSAVDLVMGSTSVVDDPAPPADIDFE
jgi:hypothetical protein